MSTSVTSPFEIFVGRNGAPLENASVYIGVAGLNPQANPVQVFFDEGMTVPAAQPLRTIGGYPVNRGTPARLFVAADDYSLVVRDRTGALVHSALSARTPAVFVLPQTDVEDGAAIVPTVLLYAAADLRRYGGDGDGSTDSTAAVTSANTVSSAGGGNIIVADGTYRITANTTIAADATIEFRQGGAVTIDSGDTLTIAGSIIAPRTQIFFGLGLVVISQGAAFPEWWGAQADGTAGNPALGTDDVIAINKAMVACKVIDFASQKTYSIDGNSNPTYSVIGGIKPQNGQRIRGNGAIIQVKTSTQVGYGCINVKSKDDIVIEDLEVIGDLDTHGATGGEFGHGFLIEGGTNVTLRNVKASKFWGDGILLSYGAAPTLTDTPCRNVSVYDGVFDDNRRDALSVVCAQGVRFYGCQFTNSGQTGGGTSPISGIDFEPDDPALTVDDCLFVGCEISGNGNQGVLKAIFPSTNITFVRCRLFDNGAFSLLDQQTGGGQKFIDCQFEGPVLTQSSVFTECSFETDDSHSAASLYSLTMNTDSTSRLDNCTITANESQRLVLATGSTSETSRKVMNDCTMVQSGDDEAGGSNKAGFSGFLTLRGCKFLHVGDNPSSRYTFTGGPFDGITTKLIDTYIDYWLSGDVLIYDLLDLNSERGCYTAAPTTGTHIRGMRYWFLSPSASAAPGCVCVTSGTFSAFSDNTGDTDGSTGLITGMTSTTGLSVGDFVSVSAGFASTGPFRVTGKTSTTITVEANSNSSQPNVTVSTPDPVFKNMANLAA